MDSDEVLYSGAIELRASIAIEQVSATISNLLRSDNNADWIHKGKAVRDITLPVINRVEFMDDGSFTRSGGDARVVYDEFGGLSFEDEGSSGFAGQFVGGGGDSSPGTAVIGTWNVGTLLNGSFGAEHTGTSAATLPSPISQVNHGSSGIDTSADTLTISGFSDPFELSSLRSMTRIDPADSNKTATIRLQNTSLTRFGAWTLVDRTDQANPVTTSGVFNYSQLTPTDFGTNSRPLRGIAQYAGRTAAVDSDGDLYNGNYRLNVTWDSNGDTISASISGLSGFTLGGQTVTQIGFQDTFSGTTFTSPASVTVQYTTSSQGEALTGASPAHDGQFLGSGGPDGPYAVVGTWSLTDPGVSGYTINGAFGADLQRAP